MKLFLLSLLAIGSVQSLTIGYPYRSVWTYNPGVAQLPVHGYLRHLDGSAEKPVYAVRQIKYFTSDSPVQKSSATTKFDEINFCSWSLLQYQNLKRDIDAVRAGGRDPSTEILQKLQTLEKIVIAPNFSAIADLPEVKDIIQDYVQAISLDEAVQSSNIKQNQGEIKTYTGISNIPLVAIGEVTGAKQAHEEHLRIHSEQIAHIKQLESELQKSITEAFENVRQDEYAKALAELERAKEEHFRLWNEAKLRTEQAGYNSAGKTVYDSPEKQQVSAVTSNQNTFNSEQNQEIQTAGQTESLKTTTQQKSFRSHNTPVDQTVVQPQQVVIRDEHSRLVDSSGSQTLKSNIHADRVVETPKVAHANEEHLHIANEAVSKSQAVHQEEEKQRQQRVEQGHQNVYEGQVITPNKDQQGSLNSPHNVEQQNLKSVLPVTSYGQQLHLSATSEVAKAREENLRLVQEANVRAQFVEQQESKYKHQSQTPILTTQYPHEQLVYQPEVVKAREQHLHLVNEIKPKTNKEFQLQEKQRSMVSPGIEETPEVKRAREEHLRVYNAIKSQVENEQTIKDERRTPDSSITTETDKYEAEEKRFLELERLREAERLLKEQQLLELERIREAKRLAEEKLEMEAELERLRMEDEQRLEMERLLEMKRLQQEQEELEKLKTDDYQEIVIQENSAYQHPQQIVYISNEQSIAKSNIPKVNVPLSQEYVYNPYLETSLVGNEPVANRLKHSVNYQQEHSTFSHNPFLKTSAVNVPDATHHQHTVSGHVNKQSSDNIVPSIRYVQSSQQSSGSKHQYIKDDHYVEDKYHNTASSQTAGTADAYERITKDHFRAYEIALDRYHPAKIHNPQYKVCNGCYR